MRMIVSNGFGEGRVVEVVVDRPEMVERMLSSSEMVDGSPSSVPVAVDDGGGVGKKEDATAAI